MLHIIHTHSLSLSPKKREKNKDEFVHILLECTNSA